MRHKSLLTPTNWTAEAVEWPAFLIRESWLTARSETLEMAHQCDKCRNEYRYTLERCPHCAYPGNYSNVVIASSRSEVDAVEQRYEKAVKGAERRGCAPQFEAFTQSLKDSVAVMARPYADVERLAEGGVQATYYDLVDAGLKLPDGSLWEELRRPADEVLFPTYREKIRFGALSTDGVGVINYGHFWMTLRTELIEHRTSIFDQNSVIFVSEKRLKSASNALVGHRASWKNRTKLAAAQLANYITVSTRADEFSSILLRQGATTVADRFIEAQIWGPVSVRTVEQVRFRWSLVQRRTPRSLLKNLSRALSKHSVTLVELS
jgi:hypothetical protein